MIHKTDEDARNGVVTDMFILWCQKLESLSEDDFKRGMSMLEHRQASIYAEGKDMWPPGYAEFIGLCQEKKEEKPPGYQAYNYFDRGRALEDKTAKKARLEAARKNCDELLKLFEL